jgi:hypothetical protein
MAYIVSAKSALPGGTTLQVEKATRKEALETAESLMGQGLADVTIKDEESGRVYMWLEFADFLGNTRSQDP